MTWIVSTPRTRDAIAFFVLQVSKTRSKILLTSRRTVFGMGSTTTHVSGFTEGDAWVFIQNRVELMGLDESAFTEPVVREIVKLTDGSPLYIEDLLRLSISAKSPGAALTMWRESKGSEVRRYALERECGASNSEREGCTPCWVCGQGLRIIF